MPSFLPTSLYSTGPISMAALATASRQEEKTPVAVFSPAESTLKSKFLQAASIAPAVTAYAPAEKGIKMYSRVRGLIAGRVPLQQQRPRAGRARVVGVDQHGVSHE